MTQLNTSDQELEIYTDKRKYLISNDILGHKELIQKIKSRAHKFLETSQSNT